MPDAITISRLCQVLNVSADFVLLGKEPEENVQTSQADPLVCPCCGRRSPAATTVIPRDADMTLPSASGR